MNKREYVTTRISSLTTAHRMLGYMQPLTQNAGWLQADTEISIVNVPQPDGPLGEGLAPRCMSCTIPLSQAISDIAECYQLSCQVWIDSNQSRALSKLSSCFLPLYLGCSRAVYRASGSPVEGFLDTAKLLVKAPLASPSCLPLLRTCLSLLPACPSCLPVLLVASL